MGTAGEDLEEMLAAHPEAWVGAFGADGLYVPLPASVRLSGQRQLRGRWPLDHMAPGSRLPLREGWRHLQELGHVIVPVELTGGSKATFHLFAVAEQHGADMLVVLSDADVDLGSPPTVVDIVSGSRLTRVVRDRSGLTLEIDEAAPEVMGWSAEDLLSRVPPLDRVHPEDRERVMDCWVSTIVDPSHGHRCRCRTLRADGTYRWMEITNFNHLDDPHRPYVMSEVLDISGEMAAHDAVRDRERLLHRLAEALPLGVLQLDQDRGVVYRNDLLGALLGVGAATSLDEQFAGVVPDDRLLLGRAFDAALDDGTDDDVVIRVVVAGSERLINVVTKSLLTDTGDVSGVVACISDVTESTLMGRELERRATFDALTGCLNRATILARLESALSPGSGGVAAVYLDLDGFKAVNDRAGHAVGDEVLRAAAQVLDETTRPGDSVGRLGGDEFLVVCTEVADPTEALVLAQRLAAEMAALPAVPGAHGPLRASIGVAWAAQGTVSADELVVRADAAMYRSKAGAADGPQLWVGP